MNTIKANPQILETLFIKLFENAFSKETLNNIREFDASELSEIPVFQYELPYRSDLTIILQKLSPKLLSDRESVPKFIAKLPKHLQICLWVRYDLATYNLHNLHQPLTIPADMSKFALWVLDELHFTVDSLMEAEGKAAATLRQKKTGRTFRLLM